MISGIYNYASQGITFLSSFITARLLLPSNYGLVGLITVFTGFISVFSDSGISLAIIKSNYGRSFQKAVDNISMMLGIVLAILTLLFAYPIAIFYNNHNLVLPTLVLSSLFIFRSLSIVRAAILSKQLKFNLLGKGILYSNLLNIIFTILLAKLGAEYWSLIFPQILASVFLLFYYETLTKLGFHFSRAKYIVFAYNKIKIVIKSLIGFNFINYWARNSDNLIVGKLYGVTDLGIYNRAYSILVLPLSLITGLMSTVLYPSLKKLKEEGGDIKVEYLFVLRIILLIAYPIGVILILLPVQLVTLFWGENWIKVAGLLPYFGILVFSQSLLSTTGNILVLQDKEKFLVISGWISGIIMISGIAFGAHISLLGVARYYSLFFITLALPFNAIFIFYKALDMGSLKVIKFWAPIIIASIILWLGCFFEISYVKYMGLLMLLIFIIITSNTELITVYSKVKKRLTVNIEI